MVRDNPEMAVAIIGKWLKAPIKMHITPESRLPLTPSPEFSRRMDAVRKAAILLLSLEKPIAAEVLSQLPKGWSNR